MFYESDWNLYSNNNLADFSLISIAQDGCELKNLPNILIYYDADLPIILLTHTEFFSLCCIVPNIVYPIFIYAL